MGIAPHTEPFFVFKLPPSSNREGKGGIYCQEGIIPIHVRWQKRDWRWLLLLGCSHDDRCVGLREDTHSVLVHHRTTGGNGDEEDRMDRNRRDHATSCENRRDSRRCRAGGPRRQDRQITGIRLGRTVSGCPKNPLATIGSSHDEYPV